MRVDDAVGVLRRRISRCSIGPHDEPDRRHGVPFSAVSGRVLGRSGTDRPARDDANATP